MTKVSSDHISSLTQIIGIFVSSGIVQELAHSSELDSGYKHIVFAIDPYGYNEKKRRRDNLMRISGLSGKKSGIVA